jgi:anti-sigma B factor antagonist
VTELLRVETARDGGLHEIRLHGELDLSTEAEVAAAIAQAEESDAERIVIDLGGLQFMDSTGIKLLVTAATRSRESGRVRLRKGSEAIQHVLRVAGIESELPFLDE